jgi:hypothetical protein
MLLYWILLFDRNMKSELNLIHITVFFILMTIMVLVFKSDETRPTRGLGYSSSIRENGSHDSHRHRMRHMLRGSIDGSTNADSRSGSEDEEKIADDVCCSGLA